MKILSQRDPIWTQNKLGTCTDTIGSHGCAITCVSMMAGVTPDYTNNRLIENGGYRDGCLLNWEKLPSLFPVEFLGFSKTPTHTPTIANVRAKTTSNSYTQHFVVWYSADRILDPWTGTETSMSKTGYILRDFRNVKMKEEIIQDNTTNVNDQEIRAILEAFACEHNRGDINTDPSKGLWIDFDYYVKLYKSTPEKRKVSDQLLANIDDIKVKQGIPTYSAIRRKWEK